jgi:hypothetical protein
MSLMNREESDRIHQLCLRIETEQDREKFLILVEELNRILTAKTARLRHDSLDEPNSG